MTLSGGKDLFVRQVAQAGSLTIANTGSLSLSQDGDPRAAYLLIDDPGSLTAKATIRRVAYDLAREGEALRQSALPHAEWVGRSIAAGRFQNP